jgi:hypothetical protein
MFTHVFYNADEQHFVAFNDVCGYVAFTLFDLECVDYAALSGVTVELQDAVRRKLVTLSAREAAKYMASVPKDAIEKANEAVNAAIEREYFVMNND